MRLAGGVGAVEPALRALSEVLVGLGKMEVAAQPWGLVGGKDFS